MNQDKSQEAQPAPAKWMAIFSMIFSMLGSVFVLGVVIWGAAMQKAHRKTMREFEERRTIAEEKQAADKAAYWQGRAKEDAERAKERAERAKRIAARVTDGESKPIYEHVYRLLHPEDNMRENSEVAVRLLTRNRKLEDIPPRELKLLHTAYNNLLDDKQHEVANVLWTNAPGTYTALRAITNSMHNQFMYSGDTTPIVEFVDREIARGNGGEHELLMLKAKALANSSHDIATKKKLVADTLVEAMAHPERQDPRWTDGSYSLLSTDWNVWGERDFVELFDATEREALDVRLNAAINKQNLQPAVLGRRE